MSLGTISSGSTTAANQMFFVSFARKLGTGELLTGTPTVTTDATGITLASKAINTAKLSTLDGSIVALIGTAVQFKVTTGKDVNSETEIILRVGYETDNSPSNTGYVDVPLFISTAPKVT